MTYASVHTNMTPTGGGGSGFSFSAFIRAFMRRLPMMIIVFILLAGLGWYMGGKMKRTYSAEGRLLVTIGDEYIFQSMGGGTNNTGLTITPDSIVLTEIGIMNNPELIDRVMIDVGMDKLFPKDFAKFQRAQQTRNVNASRDLQAQMIKKFQSAFYVAAKPKSSIVDISFKHENPTVAQVTVDRIIEEYLEFRRDVFVDGASSLIGDRREATEKQLATIDRALAGFLKKNSIGDFDSERTGSRRRTEELRAQLNTLQASMSETEAALASVENSLRNTPETIDLQVDDRASQRIAQAELERKQLLAKYLPTSDPVRAKEREITELRQLIAGANGKAVGGRRVGPNTVHQALQTRFNTLRSQAEALREKEFTVQQQLNATAAKTARLTALDPTFQNLLREKKSLEVRLSALNLREQDALVEQAQAETQTENVKVINKATLPRKGRNMKKIVQFLSIVGAGLTAILLGLLATFLDPSVYGAPNRMARPDDARTRKGDRSRRKSDAAPSIPEAVPAGQPYMPAPAYQPAAAVAAYPSQQQQVADAQAHAQAQAYPEAYPGSGPVEYNPSDYGAQNMAYAEPAAYAPQAPAAQDNPYGQNPYAAQTIPEAVSGAPASYASLEGAPSTSNWNSAMGPQPYDPSLHGGETQYITGPDGRQIPVLGQSLAGT